jgi:hypothetical protein
VGGQFQVETYTMFIQYDPDVAAEPDGDFVVVWTSYGSPANDASSTSIQGRRYASDGSAVDVQFQVNAYTTGYQVDPAVAAESDGDFVVVWTSRGSAGDDALPSYSIQGRRYASDGSAVSAQFQVNTHTTNDQTAPAVAAEPDGDFVVVWTSFGSPGDASYHGVRAQRYASDGSTVGAEFLVNSYTTGNQFAPAVAAAPDGDLAVVWTSHGSPGDDASFFSIQGQRYASDGSTVGAQFQVNSHTTNWQFAPALAAEADGDFVVAWANYSSGDDASGDSVQGQRYDSDGSTLGGEFQVNTYTRTLLYVRPPAGDQTGPAVAAEPDGDFVVVWASGGSPGDDVFPSYSIQGRRYASDGSAVSAQFQVNTYTTDDQLAPAVAAAPDGDFVVVWASYGGDDDYSSIQAQRFSVPEPQLPISHALAGAVVALLVRRTRGLPTTARRRSGRRGP